MTDVQPNPGHEPEDDYEDDELEVPGESCTDEEGADADAASDEAG